MSAKITIDCAPITLQHNAVYDDIEKVKEATEIYIKIEPEKEQMLIGLVEQFMT